jgi:replicative DNA helicase
MSKKLFSPKSEIRLLKTLTNAKLNDRQRSMLLGKTDASLFHTPAVKKAYTRLRKIVEIKQRVPVWDDLVDDPTFDAKVREFLEDSDEIESLSSKQKTLSLIQNLDRYRKLRSLFDIGKDIVSYFDQQDSLDPEELANSVADKLANNRKEFGKEQEIHTFGAGGNIKAVLKRTLFKPQEKMYRTGFAEYDRKNGGLPTTGVMILAGTTSGGKSVLATNLEHNLSVLNPGLTAIKITLEMTAEQETNRILSMLTGIPFWKIKQQKLTRIEKQKILKAAMKHDKKLKKLKSKFSYSSPTGSMTIDDVINMVKPYNYKVVILDYISLLEGVDDDNQWRMLSAICRKAKVYASEFKVLFIVLAQLDSDSNNLRYSRGMKEHADIVWTWNYSKPEVRETKTLPVDVAKARDGELFRMDLQEKFEIMRVENPPGVENSQFGTRNNNPAHDDEDDEDDSPNALS